MARLIMLFSLLPTFVLFVFAVDVQNTSPRDPQCVVNVNVPERSCDKTSCYGADEHCVRKESLQDIRKELATIKSGVRSAASIKQCSRRNLNDDREYGVAMACDFEKKRNDTVLRVAWNGALRLIHQGTKGYSCRRWYFTLNGKECEQPMTIDTQIYLTAKSINRHDPKYVEGYCRGLAAGHVQVQWNVGDCIFETTGNPGDSKTGWGSTSRIIVEEVNVEDDSENIV
ncbi:hypothetical protein LSAT2_027419 [Lamellibrachia satsuma]|nr:hypothetical protein LSAT2_027419 [Lamellibrachia satsuma]